MVGGMVPKPLGGAFVCLRVVTHVKPKHVGCQIGVQPMVRDPMMM